MFLKILAQAFEAGDFLNIFSGFLGFSRLIFFQSFSCIKEKRVYEYINCYVDKLLAPLLVTKYSTNYTLFYKQPG